MSELNQELAVSYAALILHDADIEITADKLKTLLSAANCDVESYWPMLFARALKGKDVSQIVMSCGGGSGGGGGGSSSASGSAPKDGGAAAAKVEEKEEEKEEEVDAGVGGLFGDDDDW